MILKVSVVDNVSLLFQSLVIGSEENKDGFSMDDKLSVLLYGTNELVFDKEVQDSAEAPGDDGSCVKKSADEYLLHIF